NDAKYNGENNDRQSQLPALPTRRPGYLAKFAPRIAKVWRDQDKGGNAQGVVFGEEKKAKPKWAEWGSQENRQAAFARWFVCTGLCLTALFTNSLRRAQTAFGLLGLCVVGHGFLPKLKKPIMEIGRSCQA